MADPRTTLVTTLAPLLQVIVISFASASLLKRTKTTCLELSHEPIGEKYSLAQEAVGTRENQRLSYDTLGAMATTPT